MRSLVAGLLLFLAQPFPMRAVESPAAPLEARVAPRICHAPCWVRVIVRVEPDADNRSVCVETDGENYYSSSCIQLDGLNSPPTQTALWFKDIPPGMYEVRTTLMNNLGKAVHHVRTSVLVG